MLFGRKSMRRRLPRFRVPLFVALLLSVGSSPEVVLCIGDNGHRALEILNGDCCHPRSAQEHGCASADDHCASECSDLRLAAGAMVATSSGEGRSRVAFAQMSAATSATVTPVPARWVPPVGNGWLGVAVGAPVPRERHSTVQLC